MASKGKGSSGKGGSGTSPAAIPSRVIPSPVADFVPQKLYVQFRQICRERVEKIAQVLISEKDSPSPDAKKLQSALSELHTLKGEAGMLELHEISKLVHALETRLHEVQRQRAWKEPPKQFLDALGTIQEVVESRFRDSQLPEEKVAVAEETIVQADSPIVDEVRQTSRVAAIPLPGKRELEAIVTERLSTGSVPIAIRRLEFLNARIEKEARDALHRLIVNQRETRHLLTLGNLYYSMREFWDAIEMYELAIQRDPLYAESHILIGITLHAISQWEMAISAFKKGIFLEPEWAFPHFYLGLLYEKRRQFPQARLHLRQSEKILAKGGNIAEFGSYLEEMEDVVLTPKDLHTIVQKKLDKLENSF